VYLLEKSKCSNNLFFKAVYKNVFFALTDDADGFPDEPEPSQEPDVLGPAAG
jgi:hypothetical protein